MSYWAVERQAIIIDFGQALTKLGFASEYRPRHVIRTPELRTERPPDQMPILGHWQYVPADGGAPTQDVPDELTSAINFQDFTLEKGGKKVPVQPKESLFPSAICAGRNYEEWLAILHPLLSKVFLHYLKSPPKDRRVIILDNTMSPAPFRQALAKIMFHRYQIPAINFLPTHVAPLYMTFAHTGIVVDCGYESTRVLPTEAGIPIYTAYRESPFGARMLDEFIFQKVGAAVNLAEIGPEMCNKYVEDVKVKFCYVRVGDKFVSDKDVEMTTGFGRPILRLSATDRWRGMEPFFQCSDGRPSIPIAIADAINACPMSSRALVTQNIVVVGGTACLRGFMPRLAQEVEKEIGSRRECEMAMKRLAFSVQDRSPMLMAWSGGATFGALEGATDYTETMFDANPPAPLPDWTQVGCA
eukprot:GEMP01028164.1.p1 GENE.GEMP01028164.1~~GEMP01028164.1.p1  ORF type:complete len:414 (+),score=68.10 GEMP01028164.1:189-1430(+)